MTHQCSVLAFTSPAPPGRQGFKRLWVYEPNRIPYWHYHPVTQDIYEIGSEFEEEVEFLRPGVNQGMEYNIEQLEWSEQYENWIPAAIHEIERGVILHRLNRLDQLGELDTFTKQLQKRQRDYQNYVFSMYRQGVGQGVGKLF